VVGVHSAREPGLEVLGLRAQRRGLLRGQLLARLRTDLVDEGGEGRARARVVVRIRGGLDLPCLVGQALARPYAGHRREQRGVLFAEARIRDRDLGCFGPVRQPDECPEARAPTTATGTAAVRAGFPAAAASVETTTATPADPPAGTAADAEAALRAGGPAAGTAHEARTGVTAGSAATTASHPGIPRVPTSPSGGIGARLIPAAAATSRRDEQTRCERGRGIAATDRANVGGTATATATAAQPTPVEPTDAVHIGIAVAAGRRSADLDVERLSWRDHQRPAHDRTLATRCSAVAGAGAGGALRHHRKAGHVSGHHERLLMTGRRERAGRVSRHPVEQARPVGGGGRNDRHHQQDAGQQQPQPEPT